MRFLLRHKIVNTIDRSDFFGELRSFRDTGPFAAVTWSESCPWSELSGLGDVRHAVALKQIQISARVNGHVV